MAKHSPSLRAVSLDDKYALNATDAYLTGIEALIRLPILQHQRDLQQGLNTAGLVSGYRGSPLAGLDQALWRAKTWLKRHSVRFSPSLNEELAATAISGSQQLELHAKPKFDGVFGIDAALAAEVGLRIFKVGMSWPLEPVAAHEFAKVA